MELSLCPSCRDQDVYKVRGDGCMLHKPLPRKKKKPTRCDRFIFSHQAHANVSPCARRLFNTGRPAATHLDAATYIGWRRQASEFAFRTAQDARSESKLCYVPRDADSCMYGRCRTYSIPVKQERKSQFICITEWFTSNIQTPKQSIESRHRDQNHAQQHAAWDHCLRPTPRKRKE